MKKVAAYIEKLKKATPEAQREVISKILSKNRKVMVGLILSQLMHGIDSEGKKLRAYESEEYAAFKKTLNPLGVTDLRLTGKFHKSVFANVSGLKVTFGATDSKTEKLIADYGPVIGLTKDSSQVLQKNYFEPQTVSWYKRLYRF